MKKEKKTAGGNGPARTSGRSASGPKRPAAKTATPEVRELKSGKAKRSEAKKTSLAPVPETFFTPAEHSVLSVWLNARPPDFAAATSVWEYAGLTEALEPDEIARRKASNANPEDNELANAVARILLHDSQDGVLGYADGREGRGRKSSAGTRRKEQLQPQHLFGIDWAISSSAVSWPESYDLVFVPYYERYVVTASWDSPELPEAAFDFACTELALGSFDGKQSVMGAVKAIVVKRWGDDKDLRGGEGPRFAAVVSTGLVTHATADAWAEDVWGAEDEDFGDEG